MRRLSSMLVPFSSLRHMAFTPVMITRTNVILSFKVLGEDEVDSDAPPLILLHGLLGCKRHWESLGKTMFNMTKRSVVVVDQRNHGDSPHVNSHTYEDLAEDVLRLLVKLNVDKVCLIGHSMGGRTSMCASLLAPDKIAGLLVIDISPVSSPVQLTEYFPKVLAAMKSVEFKNPKNIQKARKQARKQLKSVISDDLVMRAVLSNINMKSNSTIGWTCNLEALIKNFEHIAAFPASLKGKTYYGPTLFVGGQLSDFIPPDDLTNIRDYFPHAVVHYVPKTGHNVQVDDPKTFMEYVIAFAKRLP